MALPFYVGAGAMLIPLALAFALRRAPAVADQY